jgi:hypothetical protein
MSSLIAPTHNSSSFNTAIIFILVVSAKALKSSATSYKVSSQTKILFIFSTSFEWSQHSIESYNKIY